VLSVHAVLGMRLIDDVRAAVAGFGWEVDGGARGRGDAGRDHGDGRGEGPHRQRARHLPAVRRDTCLEDGKPTESLFLGSCIRSPAKGKQHVL
jgi:hypothetical protein